MTTYYQIDGMLVVIRGGNIKTYIKDGDDYAETETPKDIDARIAEKRRQMEKERKPLAVRAKKVVKKPTLHRNEKHINSNVIAGRIEK